MTEVTEIAGKIRVNKARRREVNKRTGRSMKKTGRNTKSQIPEYLTEDAAREGREQTNFQESRVVDSWGKQAE